MFEIYVFFGVTEERFFFIIYEGQFIHKLTNVQGPGEMKLLVQNQLIYKSASDCRKCLKVHCGNLVGGFGLYWHLRLVRSGNVPKIYVLDQ